ncbi:fructose-bisphosphate aldolase [Gammaproteobacteria bacterium SCGC AG-212-F23]|nr:fructose-bisphosphate aldolase [Gammaproteobacteria bacterium SCGC AG-212-F23]
MYIQDLQNTINILATPGKGILAADESAATIGKRFAAVGVESTEKTRAEYRELLMATPNINEFIAGVILFDETLHQKTSHGILFPDFLKKQNILAGIKVDKGLVSLPFTQEEQTTQGLDGLAERMQDYKNKGASFAKWRAVYAISANTPSTAAIRANAEGLACYAAICQAAGIVPIVEPEILIDGEHTLEQCEEVSEKVFHAVFHSLFKHHVKLEYMVLKPSMIISGKKCAKQATPEQVAKATLAVLRRTVPAAVRTINFLSGGQSPEQATANLNAMHTLQTQLPWNLSYSYARALQDYPLKIWQGNTKNTSAAQKAFYERAKLNSLASLGKYNPSMEKETSLA